MGEVAYINGKLIPLSEAKISVYDRGFMYGDGLFETIRIYKKIPFLLEKHLKRLLSSARILKMNPPASDELESLVDSVLKANDIFDGVLKIILTGGIGGRGLSFSQEHDPTLVLLLTPGVPYTEEMYQKGFSAVSIPEGRSLGYLKSLSFLPNVMAKSYADSQKAQEAFFLSNGCITEGTMSNVFMVNDRKLATPSLENKILPGITREQVLELADQLGIGYYEGNLLREDMARADEVFITNSIIELMPIVRLDEAQVGEGRPGEISAILRNKYQESVDEYVENMTRDAR